MQEKNTPKQIQQITITIINSTLLIGSLLGLVVYLLSLLNYSESANKLSYLINFSVIAILMVISIFRKRISIEIKSIIIVVGLFLIILGDVYKMGVYSDSKVFIIVIPFYSFLVYSLRKTIIIYVLAVLSFLLIGYLYISGIIIPSIDFLQRTSMINPWIINALILTIVSLVVVVIMKQYSQAYLGFITDLKQQNKKITEQERNYREIFNSSTDAIFIHDLNGKILDVNDSMLKTYGYERADIVNLDIAELSSGKKGYTVNDAQEFVKKAIQGKPQMFDWQSKKKNGEYFWEEVALKKINIAGKERVLAISRNINDKKEDELQLKMYRNHLKELVAQRTKELELANEELHASNDNLAQQKEELNATNNDLALQKEELIAAMESLKEMQEQLIKSEKMASLGVLAAGVAHEINNPLNFIQGGLYGLDNFFNEKAKHHKEQVKPLLNAINVGIERATEIVSKLDHYSRKDDDATEMCDIHKMIDDSLFMLHNKLNDISVAKEFTTNEYSLLGNSSQLHQVVLNILLNGVQAIDKKGVLSICTKIEKSRFKLSIKDTGCGIKTENLTKIFDPFYTTRQPGEGTGLGLSMSLKIIKAHKGEIEYKSEINVGTEVTISLPIA